MKATIITVFPEVRDWRSDKFPDSCSVGGFFADGSQWEVATKKGDPAQKHMDALKALIGKEEEYEVEAKPDYQGVKQYKLTGYPGKPVGGGFGGSGGRNFTPAWANTEAGERYVQERMDRRTALMQATQAMDEKEATEKTLWRAEDYYKWLRASDSVSTPPPTNTPATQQNPVHANVAPSGGIWKGDGPCPGCNAPSGKPHGSKCTGKGQEDE